MAPHSLGLHSFRIVKGGLDIDRDGKIKKNDETNKNILYLILIEVSNKYL